MSHLWSISNICVYSALPCSIWSAVQLHVHFIMCLLVRCIVYVADCYAPVGSKNGSKSHSKRHSTVLLIMSIKRYIQLQSFLLPLLVDWKYTFYLKLITRSVSVFFLISFLSICFYGLLFFCVYSQHRTTSSWTCWRVINRLWIQIHYCIELHTCFVSRGWKWQQFFPKEEDIIQCVINHLGYGGLLGFLRCGFRWNFP